jgi:hypothetical protein
MGKDKQILSRANGNSTQEQMELLCVEKYAKSTSTAALGPHSDTAGAGRTNSGRE